MRLVLPAAVVLVAAMSSSETEARTYGSILAPRKYQYNRHPFDLVSDIFSAPIYDLTSHANSLLRQHESAFSRLAATTSSTPRYAVSRNRETGVIELQMEVPGVSAKDLSVELENDSLLRIQGSRKYNHNGETVKSEFDQTFQLDEDVDPEGLEVTLSEGILRISAPKKEKVVKRLEIQTSTESPIETLEVHAKQVNEEGDKPPNEEVVDGMTITEE